MVALLLLTVWSAATATAGNLPVRAALGVEAAPEGLAPEVLERALASARCAASQGLLEEASRPHVLTIIDYSLPSTEKRMWVLDLARGAVLHHEHVAHGQGTGELEARAFSNVEGSHQSSLGLFRTAETYVGKHGRSLRLDGLEPGFNDRARDRAIVVHGADYATEAFIERTGRLGRSWGCPAVDREVADAVIDDIAEGSLLFAYYPDTRWLDQSSLLSCDAR